ncbi:MAG: type VI secretion system baseplate subunit TssK [Pikeienuella sp.]|uniref:type VI secretion system baseplate subunit TssK n=1 Tax=Pikeienuella sp. TaxID=2831957 RepID=UPI003918E387
MSADHGRRRADDAGVAAADVPDAVQWSEGMLLAPQHFQQDAKRGEMAANYRLRATRPFAWGVREIAFDLDAPANGFVNVRRLDALMPDGLIVAFRHDAEGEEALEIGLNEGEAAALKGDVWIHVGVAAHSGEAAGSAAIRRFISLEGAPEKDENDEALEETVARLRPRLRLFASAAPRLNLPNIHSIPIAHVRREGTAVRMLDYAPPCLKVRAGTLLHEAASGVVSVVRQAIDTITGSQRSPEAAGLYLSADPLDGARVLMPPLPRLAALIDSDEAPPFELYLALCDMLGAAATLDHDLAPPTARPYDHRGALACFREIAGRIEEAVGRLGPRHDLLKLEREGAGLFRLPRGEETPGAPFFLVLFPASGQSVEATAAWFLAAGVADEARMEDVLLSRVLGAGRRAIDWGERALIAVPRGAVAFQIGAGADRSGREALAPPGRADAEGALRPRLEIRHPDGAGVPGEPGLVCLARERMRG